LKKTLYYCNIFLAFNSELKQKEVQSKLYLF